MVGFVLSPSPRCYLSEVHFNIILPCIHMPYKRSLALIVHVDVVLLPFMLHVLLYPFLCFHAATSRSVQFMKFVPIFSNRMNILFHPVASDRERQTVLLDQSNRILLESTAVASHARYLKDQNVGSLVETP
jgi:hypothetical protein